MDLKQQTIAGLRWSAIQNWGSQFGSLLVFLVLARLLSPEAFGLVALANVFRSFLQVFVEQGFIQALVQREDLEPAHLDTAFWAQLAGGTALTVVCFAFAAPVAVGFDQPEISPILQALSLVLIVKSLGLVQRAQLRREFDFRSLAQSAVGGIAISGIVGIPMALAGFGVWSLVGQQLSYEVVASAVVIFKSRWRPGFSLSRRHLDDLMGFSVHVLGYRIVNWASRRVDQLLVGFFLGEVALGFYSVAHRVLEVMTQVLVTTIRQVVFPAFSRLQSHPERLRNALTQAVRFTSLISFPVFLGTAAVAGDLVPLIFGPKWLAAIPLIQIVSLSGIVVALSALLEMILLATGRPGQRLKLGLLSAAVALPACAIAVNWGIVAVAIAYVAGHAIILPVVYKTTIAPLAPVASSPLRPVAIPLLTAGAMALAIVWIGSRTWVGEGIVALAVEVTAGAAFYILSVRAFSPRVFGEFRELIGIAFREPGPQR